MMWPLVAYFAFAVVLVAAVIGLSYLLGLRHLERATGEPYEGGIVSEGSARVRFSIRYSAVARILSTAGAQHLLAGLAAAFLSIFAAAPLWFGVYPESLLNLIRTAMGGPGYAG